MNHNAQVHGVLSCAQAMLDLAGVRLPQLSVQYVPYIELRIS